VTGQRWPTVLATLALWGAASHALATGPAPLDEIRALLGAHALAAPGEDRLSALGDADLQAGLRAIDPWAEWLPAEEPANPAAGIGAEIYAADGRLWLVPFAAGALTRAGVEERVELLAVEGVPVAGREPGEVAGLLAGEAGETRRIDIRPIDGVAVLPLRIDLEHRFSSSVELQNVGGHRLIRIRAFVGRETRSFLDGLLDDPGRPRPVLLDLRDCQGGDLFEAMDTAGRFLPAGAELATLQGRVGEPEVYRAPAGPKLDARLTIFISRHTASAGEVFAGILQAHGIARLVGEPSRGKCVSQTERILSDGSVLRFTNLAITLPGGFECEGVGLTPDVPVEADRLGSLPELLDACTFDGPYPCAD
jgi:carboxyl-terminal processing protease